VQHNLPLRHLIHHQQEETDLPARRRLATMSRALSVSRLTARKDQHPRRAALRADAVALLSLPQRPSAAVRIVPHRQRQDRDVGRLYGSVVVVVCGPRARTGGEWR
jgi:hypothetical protein